MKDKQERIRAILEELRNNFCQSKRKFYILSDNIPIEESKVA